MKILIVLSFYKPGFRAGGPIQSVFNLSKLMGNSFEIFVLTQSNDFGQVEKYQIQENKWIKDENHYVKYLDSKDYNIKTIISEFYKLKPNIIYFNSLFSKVTWVFLIYNFLKNNINKIIVAPRGELDKGALSLKKNKKRIFLSLIKIVFKYNITFHATTEKEKININNLFLNKIFIAENIPSIITSKPIKSSKEVAITNFVFISRISPKKNLSYCVEIFKDIKVDGEINFDIIGPEEDKNYWNNVKKEISKLPNNINVRYLGEIPHSQLLEKTKEYHFLFFPTLAENYGHIIYECLSYGIPVIISDNTPWQEDSNGIFVRTLKNRLGFKNLIELLHKYDCKEYDKVSNLAFKYSKEKVNINKLINSYKNLFDENKK
jgi:glycosyltransferase involved in cell wall biosynthesis